MAGKLLRLGGMAAVKLAERFGTPIYVYDASVIRERCRELIDSFPVANFYYAVKANSNPELLRIIRGERFRAETVSRGEVELALRSGFKSAEISFTCSNIERGELLFAVKTGVRVHVDSLNQLKQYGAFALRRTVSLRLNQGIGGGHHRHVITGGPESKFGIELKDIPQALRIARRYKLRVNGIMQHIGSNVLDEKIFVKAAAVLLQTAKHFPDLEELDFGGGFGVNYRPGGRRFDLAAVGKEITKLIAGFEARRGRKVRVSFEPGRYPVAEAGTLLVKVTDIKRNSKHTFIGVNSGFNHLLRPAMYGSYHEIINASPGGVRKKVAVAGNICESGDVFAKDRLIALPQEGDVLAILNAGAYGYSMASRYNSRVLPAEGLVENGKARLICRRLEPV